MGTSGMNFRIDAALEGGTTAVTAVADVLALHRCILRTSPTRWGHRRLVLAQRCRRQELVAVLVFRGIDRGTCRDRSFRALQHAIRAGECNVCNCIIYEDSAVFVLSVSHRLPKTRVF